VTAGSSELEKVGSIFLQVNVLHGRIAVQLGNKPWPGLWGNWLGEEAEESWISQ